MQNVTEASESSRSDILAYEVSCRSTKDLLHVPGQIFFLGEVLWTLWWTDRLPVICQKPLSKARCTISILGDLHLSIQRDSKCASVEEFMMQDTQRESIGFDVGTTGLIPFDVGGFDPQGGFSQTDVKPTDGTGIPVHG
jgi:hypothetical protein